MKPASRPISFTRPTPLGTLRGFGVGPIDHRLRLGHGGEEAERSVAVLDVVVDRLGDADDGNRQLPPRDFVGNGMWRRVAFRRRRRKTECRRRPQSGSRPMCRASCAQREVPSTVPP